MKTDLLDIRNVENMDIMREFPDGHFDLAIVDPPYGLGEDGGTNRTKRVLQKNGTTILCQDGGYKKKEWDKKTPKPEFFAELKRVSKEQIVWGINYYPISWPGGRIIWDKVNEGSDQSDAEIAYCSLNSRVDIVRYMWRGMMQGRSIQQGHIQQGNKKLNEKRIHPTQKPVKLYEWLIEKYAFKGAKILDTHLGSGSIAIASHYAGCHLTACEADPEYFEEACKRIHIGTSQTTLL